MKHFGIYLSNEVNKELLIDNILSDGLLNDYADLTGLQGELFSTVTIDRLIEEELQHDRFVVVTEENPSLLSMSSGQRRRALLAYIIARKPQFILLDDLFGSVDLETRQLILAELGQFAQTTLLIQLFYRKQDALPFLHTVITVDGQNKIAARQELSEFMQSQDALHHLHPVSLPHLFGEYGTAMNPLIRLNGVSAFYGNKPVLNHICWTVQTGEFWQLSGPIGSGKSTLLSMIIGDNPRGFGQDMMLFGRRKGSGESIWDIKKRIGYFTPAMTLQFSRRDSVEAMVISGFNDSIGLYKKPTGLQREMANAWLQVLGPSFHHQSFNALSFGQQRILLVIRAMVKHPPLLILDEPTVGLDDENTDLFVNMINTIASQHKVAIIYVSHRPEPGLRPDKIFELVPTAEGSIGHIL
jgi:molybdate transport system ATP-binding protein